MRVAVRLWASWLGERVHPLRLAVETLCTTWAFWPLCILVYVFFARMFYPIDLEWCEGGALYEAYRLLHGLPLYSRVDPSWAPLPYPPAHTVLLALLGIARLDFWTGRLLSVAFFGLLCWTLFCRVSPTSQTEQFWSCSWHSSSRYGCLRLPSNRAMVRLNARRYHDAGFSFPRHCADQ